MTRTRFAPSPTGFLHIGGLRTALYAYALAKHDKGEFILRIEDTDVKREVEGSKEALQKTLKKFGLIWDELYIQSERLDLYKKYAEKLVKDGNAFYCNCKPKNAKDDGLSNDLRDPCHDENLTSGAVKLKVPDGKTVKYFDFVHKKEVSWDTSTVYDATLLKSDGYPTYHLAAMVDDIEMKITHILRGADWMPSTPIHLLVLEFLGAKDIKIGHLTDILSNETGKKLSKRRDSVFAEQFLDEGYLPEALLNFVMLLGWAPKDNRELFSLKEFVENFNINGLQESNPKFLRNKLDWFNGYYIRQLPIDDLIEKLKLEKNEKNIKIVNLIHDRIKKLTDFKEFTKFFYEEPSIDKNLFGKNYQNHLKLACDVLSTIQPFNIETINEQLLKAVNDNNFKVGDFFMDLRIAITGQKFTPPINESIEILGKDESLKRLASVIASE